MKFVLLKNVNGSVQVMQLAKRPDGSYSTPEIEIAKWVLHKQKEVQSWREIELEHLPKDRSFRNAWRDGGKTIEVDMVEARDIHRDRLRIIRAEEFVSLDIEMTRAFDNSSKQKEIEAKRQALRDVTADPAIEKAQTPEELMAVIPDILK